MNQTAVSDVAWQSQAACRTADPSLFQDPDDASTVSRIPVQDPARIATAKLVCSGCPVIQQCRAYAINHPDEVGIWGGLTEDERHWVRRGLPIRPATVKRIHTSKEVRQVIPNEAIAQIRAAYAAKPITYKVLGQRFGISASMARMIIVGLRRRDVEAAA